MAVHDGVPGLVLQVAGYGNLDEVYQNVNLQRIVSACQEHLKKEIKRFGLAICYRLMLCIFREFTF